MARTRGMNRCRPWDEQVAEPGDFVHRRLMTFPEMAGRSWFRPCTWHLLYIILYIINLTYCNCAPKGCFRRCVVSHRFPAYLEILDSWDDSETPQDILIPSRFIGLTAMAFLKMLPFCCCEASPKVSAPGLRPEPVPATPLTGRKRSGGDAGGDFGSGNGSNPF